MNIYRDKCPHCGTYISIPEATRCPGCISSIYWGFSSDETVGGIFKYYYYPSAESRDDGQVDVWDYRNYEWEEQRKLRNADFEWPVSPDISTYWGSEEYPKNCAEIRAKLNDGSSEKMK
jgi:hypothetical protein